MDDLDLGATIKGFSPGQKIFNRYTLEKILGRGGMGVVWLVRDASMERDIAIKMLPEVVANDPSAIRELKRETSRSQQLSHANILRIYDFAEGAGVCGITMELVDGHTLATLRHERPGEVFSVEELTPVVRQLCAALEYAHTDARIVHRDLKPSNLMLDRTGRLKVMDFGIAASLSESVSRVSNRASTSGSPGYMSPQQWRGLDPTESDDLYALGATLYELLAGQPPFKSPQPAALMHQVLHEAPLPLNARRAKAGLPPVPAAWEETIMALLAKEPGDRPSSAGEVAERLRLPGIAIKSTQSAKIGVGAVALNRPAVGRVIPNAPSDSPQTPNPRSKTPSKTPLIAGIVAVVLLLAGLGYYFGVYAPEQTRLAAEQKQRAAEQARLAEIKRLENERQAAAEAQKVKNQQELAAAETKAESERELAAAEAKAQSERERLAAERLAAARGGLVIRTNPAGAEVRVGAVALEKSPLTLKDQKLGKYPVRVRLDGYEEWTGEVEVKENDFSDLDVALIRSTGTLALTSDPAGLDAVVVGAVASNGPSPAAPQNVRTPNQLKLPTGRYDITFRRPGWPDQKQTIEVTRNQSITAVAEFAPGSLELTSAPAGAEVWQNGRRVGVTPYQLTETIPGRYDFELRLKGYQSATAGLTVAARQTARESTALAKLPGPQSGQAWTIPDLNLTLQPIAPGTFQMGSADGKSNEKPVTRVTLTQAFWLGKTEVTQREWQAVMGSNPSKFKGDDRPVEQVSWTEAMEFCRKLTERERAAGRLPEGYTYKLPTEAQWEYACRAGTTGDYAGSLDSMGWYWSNSGGTTHQVGQKQANAWGLYDMHGNVGEFCADGYPGNYPGGSVSDPTGASSGSILVTRGGGWASPARFCRSATRGWEGSNYRKTIHGFRLALSSVR